MAIVIYKNGEKTYASSTGAVTTADKELADKLDQELTTKIPELENELLNMRLVSSSAIKKDALQVWFKLGTLLNEIADRYSVIGTTDEPYFWEGIYHYVSPLIQKGEKPKRSKDMRTNHFRLCGYMARKDWNTVKSVGNWSLWRDLLDNIRLQVDARVFDWVVETLKGRDLGHKQARPFIHEVRRRIKNKETRFLSDGELRAKLETAIEMLPERGLH